MSAGAEGMVADRAGPAMTGTAGCRVCAAAARATAFTGTDDSRALRAGRTARDDGLVVAVLVPGVAVPMVDDLAEEVASVAAASSAWAVPAPVRATPIPRATAPAPNHP